MAARTDRKLAAILAADVVGYSRLVGNDEAGTIARLKALRQKFIEPLITEYHGRVVKLMGDGALVEFASAVDAVECAVAIQKGVAEREAAVPEDRRLTFRIGINVGDIIVEGDDILGDGVNVAARLEGLAEPGGICIARNVWNQVKAKLGLPFEPMGEHKVKNIAEPVMVYRINLDLPGRASGRRPVWAQRRWQAVAAVLVLLLAIGAGGAWYKLRPLPEAMSVGGTMVQAAAAKPALPLPDEPSIAVLPFENLSGDPKQERLAGGLTEDVITDLSRFRDLFVIARNSTEVYKGKAVDVRAVARELGVQYVLEGSLQIDGDHVRITAQLIDGLTGNHVWAQRYDRPLDDIFAVQDQVTEQIAGTLGSFWGRVAEAVRERARRKPPESLEAYDLYLLGIEYKHHHTKADNLKAQELLTKAIALAPNFARAYIGLAWAHLDAAAFGWTEDATASLKQFAQLARQAVALDNADAEAHLALGFALLYYDQQIESGNAEIERALTLGPSNADVHAMAGWGRSTKVNTAKEDMGLAKRAMRLNPNYPEWYVIPLGYAAYHGHEYDEAIHALRQMVNPTLEAHLYLALSLAELGRDHEAAASAADLMRLDPDFSAERQIHNDVFLDAAVIDHFLGSIKKAGLPVCATEAQLAKYPDMKRLDQCEQQRAKS